MRYYAQFGESSALLHRLPISHSLNKLCSGGEITSTFDHPELVKLGHCKLIEEVMIGEDLLIHFSGVAMGTDTYEPAVVW